MRNAVNTQLFFFRKSVDPGSDNVYVSTTYIFLRKKPLLLLLLVALIPAIHSLVT